MIQQANQVVDFNTYSKNFPKAKHLKFWHQHVFYYSIIKKIAFGIFLFT